MAIFASMLSCCIQHVHTTKAMWNTGKQEGISSWILIRFELIAHVPLMVSCFVPAVTAWNACREPPGWGLTSEN